MSDIRAIVRQELRVLGADPFPIFLLIVTPLLMLAFLSRALVGEELQSVPGLTILFGLFGISVVGHSFFRDHGWRTWSRLRASVSTPNLLLGKVAPLGLLFFAQQAIVIYSSKVFGLKIEGSFARLSMTFCAITLFELGLGLLTVALCRSIQHVSAVSTVGALLIGGVGGALAPITLLPHWAQTLGRASPAYWAMRSLRSALVGEPLRQSALPMIVLSAIGVLTIALALLTFHSDGEKQFYG